MNVTSADLALYLGQEVNEARADLLIEMAVSLVESIVNPAPDEARAVVLSSVARAYTNPSGITTEMVGPYQATRPSAGVYLTKGERATLRRLAGRSGAFSSDLLPEGYPDFTLADEGF